MNLSLTENRLVVAKGERNEREKDWEFGVSRYKLLYIEWMNNKVLRYSTENYIQYPVVNRNGKECEKSLCCTAEINKHNAVSQPYLNKTLKKFFKKSMKGFTPKCYSKFPLINRIVGIFLLRSNFWLLLCMAFQVNE